MYRKNGLCGPKWKAWTPHICESPYRGSIADQGKSTLWANHGKRRVACGLAARSRHGLADRVSAPAYMMWILANPEKLAGGWR